MAQFQKGQSGNKNGRPKGSKNKASAAREVQIKASGLTPLDFMIKCLHGEKIKIKAKAKEPAGHYYPTFGDMKWAAAAAAPYVHPKLATVTVSGVDGGAVELEHGLTTALVGLIDKISGKSKR